MNKVSIISNRIFVMGLCLAVFSSGVFFSSCKKEKGCTDPAATNYNPDAEKDDGSCTYGYNIPSEYSFENTNYGGQTVRLLLVKDLVAEIASGNATSATLNAIYQNTNGSYANIATGKDLQGKVANQTVEDSIQAWFTDIENSNGAYVRADSVDLKQMIEKTLMGAVLYYRALSDYLDGFADDDNTTVDPGKGTEMEHHWDEAFGYFGAARDYNTYTDAEIKSPGEKDSDNSGTIDPASEQCFYYAQTAAKRDVGAAGMSASSQTDFTKALFEAFVAGRAAISNNDLSTRDEKIAVIKENWEKIIAATVVHYINATKADLASGGSDLNKHWAEMKSYFNMLTFYNENKLGASNINTINSYFGNKPADATAGNLDQAKDIIVNTYGFTSEQSTGW